MQIRVVIHEAEEGGYWAEVPALPGCFTQGDTVDEVLANAREAIELYLEPDGDEVLKPGDRVIEIAV